MTLRTFLVAADALRLEDAVSFHVKTPEGSPVAPVSSPDEVKRRNADSMRQMMGMLAGVQGGPKARG